MSTGIFITRDGLRAWGHLPDGCCDLQVVKRACEPEPFEPRSTKPHSTGVTVRAYRRTGYSKPTGGYPVYEELPG